MGESGAWESVLSTGKRTAKNSWRWSFLFSGEAAAVGDGLGAGKSHADVLVVRGVGCAGSCGFNGEANGIELVAVE